MAAHKYWRLYMTARSGTGSFTGMAELDLRSGGVSQAFSGAISSNTAALSGYEAWRAGDGNASTFFVTAAYTAGSTDWRFKFGKPFTIASFSIKARTDAYFADTPVQFRLQHSTDGGSTWTTIQSYSSGNYTQGETKTFTVTSPISTTLVRILVDARQGGAGSNIGFTDVEFFDAANVGYLANYYRAATASTSASTALTPNYAFDNDTSTRYASSTALPQWIKHTFINPVDIDSFAITSSTSPLETVIGGILQYSDDDVNWGNARSFTTPNNWTSLETRTFSVASSAAIRPQIFVCT